jgi:hypothetical protein
MARARLLLVSAVVACATPDPTSVTGEELRNASGHFVATAETAVRSARLAGTTLVATRASDGAPEQLAEVLVAGSYRLDHRWTIGAIAGAGTWTFHVVARRGEPDGDDPVFEWSTATTGPWTPICTLAPGDTTYQACKVTADVAATKLYVHVVDAPGADPVASHVDVDYLALVPFDCATCAADECITASACNATETGCVESYAPEGTLCDVGTCSAGLCVPAAFATRQTDGLVAIEAEHADASTYRNGHGWTADPTAGASGTALATVPANSGAVATGYADNAPRLSYAVTFAAAGTYRVWIRGRGPNSSGDTCHVGLDGAPVVATATMGPFPTTWTWKGGGAKKIEVASPGLHTIDVWMYEDGLAIDKLVLTPSGTYVPTGTGPPESPRFRRAEAPAIPRSVAAELPHTPDGVPIVLGAPATGLGDAELQLTVDDTLDDPLARWGQCVDLVTSCYRAHAGGLTMSECIDHMPPCADDAGGAACCPPACIADFRSRIGAGTSPDDAVEQTLVAGTCVGGLSEQLAAAGVSP